jgi:hypothetical protein
MFICAARQYLPEWCGGKVGWDDLDSTIPDFTSDSRVGERWPAVDGPLVLAAPRMFT